MSGPLEGIRIVELQALGPVPHAGMLLADLGAEIVRVLRPNAPAAEHDPESPVLRGRTYVEADLKNPGDVAAVLDLVAGADVLLEGNRPGVTERLRIGPDECLGRNPRLIYGRMTGWGQTGPRAHRAGHDINYIGLGGALAAIGPQNRPAIPLNLVGDYAGGSLMLVIGVLAALSEREKSGTGQVVDAAIVDGVAAVLQPILDMRRQALWVDEREANIMDGHAPFYRTYVCADGGHLAVGSIEPQFYAQLLDGLHLDPADLPHQHDRSRWPELADRFAAIFASRPRAHWESVFDETDACVTPVRDFAESASDPHLRARGTLYEDNRGSTVAAPAPRFSRTEVAIPRGGEIVGLREMGSRWGGLTR
ncbi:CaiB/BaiF CoA transferase family protein [Nocardia sp. NPDC004278]